MQKKIIFFMILTFLLSWCYTATKNINYNYDVKHHSFSLIIDERNVLLQSQNLEKIWISPQEYQEFGDLIFDKKGISRIWREKKWGMILSGNVLYIPIDENLEPFLLRYEKLPEKTFQESLQEQFWLSSDCIFESESPQIYQAQWFCPGLPTLVDRDDIYYPKIYIEKLDSKYYFLKMRDISGAVNLQGWLKMYFLPS